MERNSARLAGITEEGAQGLYRSGADQCCGEAKLGVQEERKGRARMEEEGGMVHLSKTK